MRHKSPLSVVDDVGVRKTSRVRQKSWGETIVGKVPGLGNNTDEKRIGSDGSKSGPTSPVAAWTKGLPRNMSVKVAEWLGVEEKDAEGQPSGETGDAGSDGSDSGTDDDEGVTHPKKLDSRREADKSLKERVKTPKEERRFELTPIAAEALLGEKQVGDADGVAVKKKKKKAPIGTRLTMTSRVGYFQDRIITPSMVRYTLNNPGA